MRYRRSSAVTWELADDRAVILDAAGSSLTTLNPVGTLLWCHLDQPREQAEVTGYLSGRFPGVERSRLHDDTEQFLAELTGDGLLVAVADES